MSAKESKDLEQPQKKRQILRLSLGKQKRPNSPVTVVQRKNRKISPEIKDDKNQEESRERIGELLKNASNNDLSEDNAFLEKLKEVNKKIDDNSSVPTENQKKLDKKDSNNQLSVAESKTKTIEDHPKNIKDPIDNKKDTLSKAPNNNFVAKNNYSFDDGFNEKLKKSIAVEVEKKREKEEKLESVKKQETVVSQTLSKIRLKKGNSVASDSEKEDDLKKKSPFKLEKNKRRSQKTYIIEEDNTGYSKYSKYSKRREKKKSKNKGSYEKIAKEIKISGSISVTSLAEKMAEKSGDVIKKLFTMGSVVTINQSIDVETAEIIIGEFGHKCVIFEEFNVESKFKQSNENIEKKSRPPVVTIMGHVDHGKTSILDAIRSTDVVSGESGGITQHVGAFNVTTKNGKKITFLDTPGHEAFTEMRSRGANVTDIVILVVAADDGVKNQTIEAINHAKAADVSIIVAINKIDKQEANPANVKNELLNHSIISEDLGGDVIFVEVSAKEKINLDKLEEAILLQSEMMELNAPYDCLANGVVVESKIDKHRGVIASLIVQEGTLKVSDLIVAGTAIGKVKTINNNQEKNAKSASPSMAIDVLGLDKTPNAGDKFFVVSDEKIAREIVEQREKVEQEKKRSKNNRGFIKDMFQKEGEKIIKQLPLIIKADVSGSVEALSGSIEKLKNDEIEVKMVHQATGGINESDINLATVTGATVVGFNIKPSSQVKSLAELKGVNLICHSIIYDIIDNIKKILGGMLGVNKKEKPLGSATIREIFEISGTGNIAGCIVSKDSVIKRGGKARLVRDEAVVYDGSVLVLKRFKDDVKEVISGFECGILLENYNDIKIGDIIESYEIIEEQRSL
jgi:translation initiation factor IF-2